ncbi:lysine/arginine/ornithine ABC transporter substrate-binding protein [Pseudomonas sp. BN102]|uniref:lysine/arginine/ornithine ABC transporter substrate-binding protein n=1 Tax=Pseudomonas sp. BN102 TaxID=2567886 RepID=UPI0024566198|nr:lysine/arginine/ornithine ABC transporter substrate-binding protein [Pseudomonas sp. BN102]MDH4607732.1 transporter substrate-binding domain-containing protein [Pseudomonas sp. BN102]
MRKQIVASLLALLASGQVLAQDAETLRIGVEASYPPFSYKKPDGSLAGFEIEIGNALCADMQVRCTWVEQPFDGLIPALRVKKIDGIMSSMTVTSERLKVVDFSRSYYKTPARFVTRKDRPEITAQGPLDGLRVAVLRGSVHARYVQAKLVPRGVQMVQYGSQQEADLDLISGRVDAMMADAINLKENFLKSEGGKDFAFNGPSYDEEEYFGKGAGIAFRKGNDALMGRFNHALGNIGRNGTYQKIYESYFPDGEVSKLIQ